MKFTTKMNSVLWGSLVDFLSVNNFRVWFCFLGKKKLVGLGFEALYFFTLVFCWFSVLMLPLLFLLLSRWDTLLRDILPNHFYAASMVMTRGHENIITHIENWSTHLFVPGKLQRMYPQKCFLEYNNNNNIFIK